MQVDAHPWVWQRLGWVLEGLFILLRPEGYAVDPLDGVPFGSLNDRAARVHTHAVGVSIIGHHVIKQERIAGLRFVPAEKDGGEGGEVTGSV